MKWGRIRYNLEQPGIHNWLLDNQKYSFEGAESLGSKIVVIKKPGPYFDLSINPWWGPEVKFNNISCAELFKPDDTQTELTILWETPHYKIYFNNHLVAERQDTELAAAADIALPYSIYNKLKRTKTLFDIKRPPEPSEAWEFSEFPRYLASKYNLNPNNAQEFLYNPSNRTQKAREQLAAWVFISTITKAMTNNNYHVAILTPYEDRGVDIYIRMINTLAYELVALPIQVCEVRIKSSDASKSIDGDIFNAIYQAKSRPHSNRDNILLCDNRLIGTGMVDPFVIRRLFEQGQWPFRKIILMTSDGKTTIIFTVFCDNIDEHFIIVSKDSKPEISVGYTREDIQRNSNAAKQGISLQIII
ncbi:MAG: hypothetical protein U9N44_04245 [Chloroflexota bacterium]|nr:hypothetical protein [Chloroflexota bacterium]